MAKLSKLDGDAMLVVMKRTKDGTPEPMLLSKKQFMRSSMAKKPAYTAYERVSLLKEESKTITMMDLCDIVDVIAEYDAPEEWVLGFVDTLCELPETKAFIDAVNRTLESFPMFREGEAVEIDMRLASGGKS